MDMLPVNRSAAERFRLGLDEITVLATSAQTNGDLSPSKSGCRLGEVRQ
jgi:hypothetical protein